MTIVKSLSFRGSIYYYCPRGGLKREGLVKEGLNIALTVCISTSASKKAT